MAATSDAVTDRVSRATAPSLATATFCCWARVNAVHSGNLFHPVVRVDASGSTAAIFSFRGTNGRTPQLYSSSSTTGIVGAEIALSTWVFLAFTMNAGPAQLFYGTTAGSLTKVTGTVNTSGTPGIVTLFGRSPTDTSEWLEGTLAHARLWTAVLSDAEIAAESLSATPVRTANSWATWPLSAASLADTSGNSRPLTAGTTALAADTDPPLGGTQTGALAAGVTASVSIGAFTTRPQALPVAATAVVSSGAFAERPQALPMAATVAVDSGAFTARPRSLTAAAVAAVDLGAFADRVRALDLVAAAAVQLAPVRDTSAALDIAAAARLDLSPVRDTSTAFAVTATASVALDAATERAAALAADATSHVTLAPVREQPAALNVASTIQVSLTSERETEAALQAIAAATLTMIPAGQQTAALEIAAITQVVLGVSRTTSAAVDIRAAAAVTLAAAVDAHAALEVATVALVAAATDRDAVEALLVGVTARLLVSAMVVPGEGQRDITVTAVLLSSWFRMQLRTNARRAAVLLPSRWTVTEVV